MLLTGLQLIKSGHSLTRFQKLTVYFDYCNESVIPPLLENWQQFQLPHDLDRFMSLLKDADLKGSMNSNKRKQERHCVKHLQDSVTSCGKYMDENPDWFLSYMEPQPVHNAEVNSLSDDVNHSNQPLDVITVEPLSNISHCPSLPSIPAVMKPSLEKSHSISKLDNIVSSLDSWSSSYEDLEHDVNYILNPSLPLKDSILPAYSGWIDILPPISTSVAVPTALPGSSCPRSPSSLSSLSSCDTSTAYLGEMTSEL